MSTTKQASHHIFDSFYILSIGHITGQAAISKYHLPPSQSQVAGMSYSHADLIDFLQSHFGGEEHSIGPPTTPAETPFDLDTFIAENTAKEGIVMMGEQQGMDWSSSTLTEPEAGDESAISTGLDRYRNYLWEKSAEMERRIEEHHSASEASKKPKLKPRQCANKTKTHDLSKTHNSNTQLAVPPNPPACYKGHAQPAMMPPTTWPVCGGDGPVTLWWPIY